MGTVIKNTLIGAVLGAVGAIVLYILGFGIELLNCACAIITCNCDSQDAIPGMWSGGAFVNVLIFCTIGGAVLGFVYGLIKMKAAKDADKAKLEAENSEAARNQRQKWASEVKQKALSVSNTCDSNAKNVGNLVQTSYKSESQMKEILNELASVSELKGKIDSMAEDVKKGGVI